MSQITPNRSHVSFEDSNDGSKLTLHEAISKKIDRAPNGLIFSKDLKNIFALTMICLDLQEKPARRTSFLTKPAPYSFTLQEIIDKMAHLSLKVESTTTSTTLSHSIKGDLAVSLVKKFMTAKLIHTPADRTRSKPKPKVLIQPTPKGVNIIQSYCKSLGFKNVNLPAILKSTLNSMDLFMFERSPVTDTIIFSEYFIHMLFLKFLGDSPNVWKSTNPPDEIPSLDFKFEQEDEFDFSNFSGNVFKFPEPPASEETNNKKSFDITSKASSILPILNTHKKTKSRESPLAHNFFTNPESDSHVQYYVSNKGVRLYKNHKFGEKQSIAIKYCFNAKAAWQWLMDCTDITYSHEATNVLNLFYKYGLMTPIIIPPSTATSKKKFMPLKTSFFTPSKEGWEISSWNKSQKPLIVSTDEEIFQAGSGLILSNQALNSSDVSSDEERTVAPITNEPLTLKKALADPGIRYLFRSHLEKEFCAENLEVYLSIKQFSKKTALLKNVIEMQKQENAQNVNGKSIPEDKWQRAARGVVVRLVNECLSSAYDIYSSYITILAPYQLNIDHTLREKIAHVMIHPSSPLAPSHRNSGEIRNSLPPPAPAYIPGRPPVIEQTNVLMNSSAAMLNSRTEGNKPTRNINNKNLSIDVKSSTAESTDIQRPLTPTQVELSRSLLLLHKLFPLFEDVATHILKLMEYDSFPKFLASETFAQANKH